VKKYVKIKFEKKTIFFYSRHWENVWICLHTKVSYHGYPLERMMAFSSI